MGFPPLLGALSVFAEFFGSLGLISGTLTRVAGLGVTANMAVAMWMTLKAPDLPHNIFGIGNMISAQTLFYPMVLMCLGALGLIFTGGGAFSVDAKLFARPARKKG